AWTSAFRPPAQRALRPGMGHSLSRGSRGGGATGPGHLPPAGGAHALRVRRAGRNGHERRTLREGGRTGRGAVVEARESLRDRVDRAVATGRIAAIRSRPSAFRPPWLARVGLPKPVTRGSGCRAGAP